MLTSFSGDLRHAVRRLGASPGFTLTTLVTIAIGVGLNTGVFSVVNGIFFSSLPVPGGDELVDMYETVEGVAGRTEKSRVNPWFTTSEYETLRERTATLTGLLGYSIAWPVVLGEGASRAAIGRYITCNYFDVLRQPPAVGRTLTASDCAAGADPVVVLSHEEWSRQFAADPAIVGTTITLNGRPVTVAGVASADAYQPELEKLDFYAPISAQPYLRPDREWLVSEESGWLTLVGRRAARGTIEAVRAELNVIAAQIDRQQPGRATSIHVERAKVMTNRPGESAGLDIVVALLPFGLVLLVACANVANLFFARTSTRAPEIALRLSLGAGRSRVARELLTEMLIV